MFYGVPGGLSGSGWGTQDQNGVWSGWSAPQTQGPAPYVAPTQDAAFGATASPYTANPSAYSANMTPAPQPVPVPSNPQLPPPYQPGVTAAPQSGQMMNAGGSANWLSGNGGAYQPGIANDPTGGGGLGSNPYMGAQADFLRQQMQDALGQNLQSIRSNSVGNGTLGGSRQGVAEGLALKGFNQNYGSNLANMLSGNYQFDRNLNTNSYNTNRGLDLQQTQLGGNLMQQGLGMQWSPIQNANAQYTPYTGLGSQSTPSTGGGFQGALGSGLSGLALAAQLGLFK